MNSSQLALVAALCALAMVLAGLVAAREWRGRVVDLAKPASRRTSRIRAAKAGLPEAWQRRWRALVTTAGITVLAVWAWTGWPVHGILAGAAVLGFPFLLNPGVAAEQRIERLEAIGQWLNGLAGIHTAGISLVQTIRASARNAPAPIAANVRALDERLRSGMDAKQAFALFADELGDGVVDHVALLFQSHAANMGPGLATALEALAVTIHQQAADARDIESDRAKIRKSSRIVSIVICIVFVGCMLNEAWSAWYQSGMGQIALAILGALFAWTLSWLRRAAASKPDPRLLNPLPQAEPAAATGAAR
ncbi:type II secretion system F family protein (plasmid) [Streptomyces sp. NBC_00513]|uniref:type II secretion system F family protein n=1 Tax=unclassified Streptomyces TaxID=2593676 RepID=UPI00224DB87C|nr:type II secretion system F family protein [Streptomyces sp. NBC_00424]MCX5078850.1 type II secretion system F family protein [Streptomyces sp. NBC_00424]WUD46230.1 type II secretion system F family protein [Streptomyces sp. NBC_00513]